MSDWVYVLDRACAQSSQSKVAKRLGYSEAVISQARKGKYAGDLEKLRRCVEGEFMGVTVNCPVLGEITSRACLDIQKQPFAATNPQRVKLYRACRNGCQCSLLECAS